MTHHICFVYTDPIAFSYFPIPRQSLVAIHLPDMEKLKDMVIQQVNVYATPMVVGTYLYICTIHIFLHCAFCLNWWPHTCMLNEFALVSCDCDHQNEGYAVRNLATYGPAVVCLDASTWQDYTGGIITSDSGCSSGFMDVNHCVQAVGYAFLSDEEYDIEVNENQSGDKNQNSRSGSGSQDSTKRKGYWIVRNQWSTYWGMNGYAYVAMGDNTCGILNDMMQAYT